MITLNARKLFRIVSLVVMVALMFSFARTMAQSYCTSMQCITDMSVACQNQAADNSQVAYSGDNNPATDEWLCANNEVAYCAPSQSPLNGIEVVQLKND